ncbi:MAG: hypothetical protein FJ291_07565 [Planctomycetes bacterium]|nr:hypothetical protein [Planctomycetota bacterium]
MAVCLTLALVPDVVRWLWGPVLYESMAIIEIQDCRPIGEAEAKPFSAAELHRLLVQAKVRMLSWSAVRDIVQSGKVNLYGEFDPHDRRDLERLYEQVEKRTTVVPLGSSHIAVSHRSISPERNAALVNELVIKFIGEDRLEQRERAKADLKYYRDKLAVAKTQLSEIDNQMREFNQQYPWLPDTLAETQKEYENAEAEALSFRQQIRAIEESVGELRKDLAKEKPEVVTEGSAEPNPKYAALQARILQLEKEKEKLEIRRMDGDKRVSEFYIRRRRAPELLGERQALQEQRSTAAGTASEYAGCVRLAEKEMMRLLSEAHSSRFIVREYARDDRRPVRDDDPPGIHLNAFSPRAQEDPNERPKNPALAAIEAEMLLYAGGTAAALVPAVLLLVLARIAARRADAGAGAPGRASKALIRFAAAFCVAAPLVGLWAAVAHVRAEHPLWPETPGKVEKASGEMPSQSRPREAPIGNEAVATLHTGNIELVPKLPLGNGVREAPASRSQRELARGRCEAGASQRERSDGAGGGREPSRVV